MSGFLPSKGKDTEKAYDAKGHGRSMFEVVARGKITSIRFYGDRPNLQVQFFGIFTAKSNLLYNLTFDLGS
jgi:hypothetical protein